MRVRAPDHHLIRFVMIDDAEHIRPLVRVHVDDDGRFAWVGEAAAGPEGIDVVVEVRPDAVLCDVQMPGMDGLEVLDTLRRHDPALVVVMYSSDPSVRQQALDHGADAFFEKGDPIPSILDMIAVAVRGRAEGRGA
jgi:DNA-binding NarL/FixJ family response regulator